MKKTAKLISIIAVLVLVFSMCFALVACNNGGDDNSEQAFDYSKERSAVDMSGNTVTVSGEIKRIVNLWPAGTSSFIAMGAGDRLVAVAVNGTGTMTSWSQLFYEGATEIPALGGTTPNVEAILNLNPDLVIIHPTTAGSDLHNSLIEAGIPTANINFTNYSEMVKAYTFLGTILGGDYQKKLANWCSEVNTRIENVRALTASVAADDKPLVYYVAGQSNNKTQTMAANSIIKDWVESAGGKFAMAEWTFGDGDLQNKGGIPDATNPTEEFILSKKDDIDILMVGGVYQHTLISQIKTSWSEMAAVENDKVYNNPYACFNWDRFGLESLLQINYAFYRIQPALAASNGITEASIKADIKDFYKTYTGYELTDAQVGYMFQGLTPTGTQEIAA